jgi:translation initiation factor 3 subunit D
MNCYVLPEWNEKRQSWVSELDSKQANCFTRELTDNKTKFERWTVQSLLAGAEKMKFAFVQRADKEGNSHRVVGSHMTSTKNFSLELGLNLQNCWATLLAVVEEVSSRDETVG